MRRGAKPFWALVVVGWIVPGLARSGDPGLCEEHRPDLNPVVPSRNTGRIDPTLPTPRILRVTQYDIPEESGCGGNERCAGRPVLQFTITGIPRGVGTFASPCEQSNSFLGAVEVDTGVFVFTLDQGLLNRGRGCFVALAENGDRTPVLEFENADYYPPPPP